MNSSSDKQRREVHIRALTPLSAWILIAVMGSTAGCNDGGETARQLPETLVLPTSPTVQSSSRQSTHKPQQATRSPGHLRMVSRLADIQSRVAEKNLWLGDRAVRQVEAKLAELPDEPSATKAKLLLRLGVEELRLGRERRAIEHCSAALNMISADQTTKDLATFWLGVCFMRLGETQNCCNRNTPESCILPIRGEGIHSDREGSEQAIHYFMEVLKNAKPGSSDHHRAKWLLNIAHMTIASYPDGVPPEYLVEPSTFESEQPFPRFVNVASQLALNTLSLCGGAIADDFDNDGFLDLVVSSYDPASQLHFFHNQGNGQFIKRTKQAGLLGIVGGLNLVQADYDNDGHLDFLVLRGAWFRGAGRHPNSLLHNNGDGTFTDVTYDAGLGHVDYPTQTASWADFDLDGDLDLYIGNETDPQVRAPCQLFENNGDGTFTDIAVGAGVTNDQYTKAVIWGDYDGDRWPDLYVSNLDAPNRLYHNNGDGTFADLAVKLGVFKPIIGFPAWFWDFDNDGNLDLFAAAYAAHESDIAASADGSPFDAELPRLYRNTGDGFEDVTRRCNLVHPSAPMGSNFGDVDGDGFLDFFLGTGRPAYHELMPNLMFHNDGGKKFYNVTTAGGFGNLQKGHAVVFADLDHDGDQDIFEQMGGALPGDMYYDALYENPGFGNNWIVIKLIGNESNRCAIGARIRAEVVEDGNPRSIYKHVNSGATFGGSPLRQYLGLGKNSQIATLEIFWPVTGITQRFDNVPAGQMIEITEGKEEIRSTPLPRFKLGSTANDS